MNEKCKPSWKSHLGDIGSFEMSNSEFGHLCALINVTVSEKKKENINRLINNHLAACALFNRDALYHHNSVEGRIKRDGATRNATPILSFRKSAAKLMEHWRQIERDNHSADFIVHYEAEKAAHDLPEIAAIMGNLNAHLVLLTNYFSLSGSSQHPFVDLVKNLASVFEEMTGKRPGRSNTPGQKFPTFVRAIDEILPQQAKYSTNTIHSENANLDGAESDADSAWAQRVYRALSS